MSSTQKIPAPWAIQGWAQISRKINIPVSVTCANLIFNSRYFLYSDRALRLTYIALSSDYMDCSETLSFVRFSISVADNSFIHSKSEYSL